MPAIAFLIANPEVLNTKRQSTGHQPEQSWHAIQRKVPIEVSMRVCILLVTADELPMPVTSPTVEGFHTGSLA